MKPLARIAIIPVVLVTAALTGCVVAPLGARHAYHAPAGVVYVAPTYAAPAHGYRWSRHHHHGWGWHHHRHGWHRGWH